MDRLSSERRSWNMSRIRGRNTRPEMIVRSLLHGLGLRFRLQSRQVPGKPDIVLPKYKTAIFVHGCFWHRHPECRFAYQPKSNQCFWQEKFLRNVSRDEKVSATFEGSDWKQVIIWECELRDREQLTERLRTLFSPVQHRDPAGTLP